MQSTPVQLVKAFTKNPKEGNPAGVVLEAKGLTDTEMQNISAGLGFSESAFIFPSEKAHYKIRFFSPTKEVDLCAHASIAAVHVLKESKRLKNTKKVILESNVGLLELECQDDGLIVMTQAKPEFLEYEADRNRLAKLLNLNVGQLRDWPIKIVSTGTPKLLVPLISLEAVQSIIPDLEGIKDFCRESGARGVYPFTTETKSSEADFYARQFNPLAGIDEDPITGIAAGALGAYLKYFKLSPQRKFIIEQGDSMGKPGRIYVNVTHQVKVGGYAVGFGETSIQS